jgi:alpha-L-rhamnosidase
VTTLLIIIPALESTLLGMEIDSPPIWIWAPDYRDSDAIGKFVFFRKVIVIHTLDQAKSIFVKVSADTRYRLFINGVSVSFGPCKSYLQRWFYVVDIAPFLKHGINILAAKVLRYSQTGAANFSLARGPLPGFFLECKTPVSSAQPKSE